MFNFTGCVGRRAVRGRGVDARSPTRQNVAAPRLSAKCGHLIGTNKNLEILRGETLLNPDDKVRAEAFDRGAVCFLRILMNGISPTTAEKRLFVYPVVCAAATLMSYERRPFLTTG